MKLIEEQMSNRPHGTHMDIDAYDSCKKITDKFLKIYSQANSVWAIGMGRSRDAAKAERFYKSTNSFEYVENDACIDISKLTYFLALAKGEELLPEFEMTKLDTDIETFNNSQYKLMRDRRESYFDESPAGVERVTQLTKRINQYSDSLNDAADYLEGKYKESCDASIDLQIKLTNEKYPNHFQGRNSLVGHFKDSIAQLIKKLDEEDSRPDAINVYYEPRSLSLSRDFGRGLGFDFEAHPEANELTLIEKHRLLSLSTPTVYLSRGFSPKYTMRCADHPFEPCSSNYRRKDHEPDKADIDLLVDSTGDFNAKEFARVCKELGDEGRKIPNPDLEIER